jgi:sugar/nucleoside kinase (ribokinase family)
VKKKVLVIGSTMQDIFMYSADKAYGIECLTHNKSQYLAFKEGSKVELKKVEYQLGGGAANSAAAFSKLGYDSFVISKVGTDQEGLAAKATLKKLGIETKWMSTSKNARTGTSYILPCPSGNHAILVHRGANLTLTKKDLHLDQLAKFDLVHITSLSGATSALLPIIARTAKKHNLFVSCNPGSSQLTVNVQALKDSLRFIDVLICNQFEAKLLFGLLKPKARFSEKSYLKTICAFGPKVVAVTCGKHGVYATDGTTIYFQAIIPMKVVSTVGAGDAFSSTFVAYLADGHSVKTALLAGSTQSAYVLKQHGATEGLLNRATLKKKISS